MSTIASSVDVTFAATASIWWMQASERRGGAGSAGRENVDGRSERPRVGDRLAHLPRCEVEEGSFDGTGGNGPERRGPSGEVAHPEPA